MKENEKIDKYLDLVRELKKLWNMKVTAIPIVVGVFEAVPKRLEKKLEELKIRGRIDTVALLRSAGMLRIILGTWEELLSLNFQWKYIS